MYEGRLRSHECTAHHRIRPNGGTITKQAGTLFVPVEHEGNSQGCEEEACTIEQIVTELLDCYFWDTQQTRPRKLTLKDILMVAPFNLQVRLLKKRFGSTARIGSVDKFHSHRSFMVTVDSATSRAAPS